MCPMRILHYSIIRLPADVLYVFETVFHFIIVGVASRRLWLTPNTESPCSARTLCKYPSQKQNHKITGLTFHLFFLMCNAFHPIHASPKKQLITSQIPKSPWYFFHILRIKRPIVDEIEDANLRHVWNRESDRARLRLPTSYLTLAQH